MIELLKRVQAVFKQLSDILENPVGNRLAYVTSYFTFDDDSDKMNYLANKVGFMPRNTKTTELAFRINTPEVVQGEDVNVVTNINNVLIGNNAQPEIGKRRSLMVTYDINTLHNNLDNRFDFNLVLPYFDEMVNIAVDHINNFKNI